MVISRELQDSALSRGCSVVSTRLGVSAQQCTKSNLWTVSTVYPPISTWIAVPWSLRMSATVTTGSLCDNCHLKPKFGGHQYCGRTCAAQASASQGAQAQTGQKAQPPATLCIQCHQRPKFGYHDYCGKACAQTASMNKGAGRSATQSQRPQQTPSSTQTAPQSQQHPPHGAAPQHQGRGAASTGVNQDPPPGSAPPAAVPKNVNVKTVPGQAAPAGPPAGAPVHAPQPPQICALPGCAELAYRDASGTSSGEYCSRRHRDEAARTRIEMCIMCGKLPQGRADRFCGKTCRDKALRK
ncbi:hypothetical protein B0H21DRAFT_518435 [Amylocystis lapponica]|nr:hypothetical protein B0H21DRAFT_518435 [Amylocystis lapponica]